MNRGPNSHLWQEIAEPSQVGQARREAGELARVHGLPDIACGRLAIIVNELATNVLKHAGHGALLLRALDVTGGGVELIALDQGPGMPDLERCLADGYSTAGTRGTGLGAVRRLADEFDAWSGPSGTAVVARIGGTGAPANLRTGAVCVAMHGESHCGDAWSTRRDDGELSVLVADGLGHGDDAAQAADAAVAAFLAAPPGDPERTVREIDARLHGTRGAAVAVACVDGEQRSIRYCGIGNIAARLEVPGGSRGLVSNNGIAGAAHRRPQVFEYRVPESALLVLHSDGLRSRWDLDHYSGLRARDPTLIAAVLFRDCSRGADDVTVVVTALRNA